MNQHIIIASTNSRRGLGKYSIGLNIPFCADILHPWTETSWRWLLANVIYMRVFLLSFQMYTRNNGVNRPPVMLWLCNPGTDFSHFHFCVVWKGDNEIFLYDILATWGIFLFSHMCWHSKKKTSKVRKVIKYT